MYERFIEAEVHNARHALPGNIRQRVKKAIDDLTTNPRPANSKVLGTDDIELPSGVEIWRIRMDHWRILYAINDAEQWVWVLRIQRRPPYNYNDLADLAAILS